MLIYNLHNTAKPALTAISTKQPPISSNQLVLLHDKFYHIKIYIIAIPALNVFIIFYPRMADLRQIWLPWNPSGDHLSDLFWF